MQIWIRFSRMQIWIYIILFARLTSGVYQVFKDKKSWKDSQDYCQLNNGKLAHIYSKEVLPENLRRSTLDFWVGGVLNDQGFNWITKNNKVPRTPLKPLVHHRGCYRPAFILGGHRLNTVSSEECFKTCNWKGVVGLKSIYCLCEGNLRNITRTNDINCESRCTRNAAESCGGPRGVSMYNLNKKAVLWGVDEPTSKYECVYIKKLLNSNSSRWFTALCNLKIRYLCYFEDHDACGIKKSCVRSSVEPDTWEGSIKGCRLLNGTLAVIDVTMMYDNEDTGRLPPGEYWIGLKRIRRWEWINGLPISASLFHHRRRPIDDNKMCAAISSKSNALGLSNAPCSKKKPFICQYDMKLELGEMTTKSLRRSQNMESNKPQGINEEVLIKNNKNTSSDDDQRNDDGNEKDYQTSLYKSIMYLAIGVASGMGFVFSICIIAYVGKRCKSRNTEFKTVRYPKNIGNPILRYANDAPNNHTPSEPEVLYEIPCDAQESPFRATQRILHQNYAINREFPTNSWRRRKAERENNAQQFHRQPEVRSIDPYHNRSYGDTSYIIHNRAQCHSNSNSQGMPVDISYTGSLDTRLRRLPENRDNDVRLSETYSFPEQGRKMSEPMLHVDTSDLYACVEKAMQSVDGEYYDDKEQGIRITVC